MDHMMNDNVPDGIVDRQTVYLSVYRSPWIDKYC